MLENHLIRKRLSFVIMKSKDLQKVSVLKRQNRDYPTKIFRAFHEALGSITAKRWCRMIDEVDFIIRSFPYNPYYRCNEQDQTEAITKKDIT